MEGVAGSGSRCEASSGICVEVNVIATREGRNWNGGNYRSAGAAVVVVAAATIVAIEEEEEQEVNEEGGVWWRW